MVQCGGSPGARMIIWGFTDRERPPGIDLFRPGVLLTCGVTERLCHVSYRCPRPVADHIGHLGGIVTAVAPVDLLDYLLASVGVEVDVNVWFFIASGREKAFEGQFERNGVDR